MSRSGSSRLALVMFIVLTLTLSTTVTEVISKTQPKQTPAYIYTVLGPKVIRPYFTYKVSVSIVAREDASASSSVSLVPLVAVASIVDGRDGKTWYNSDPMTLHPGNTSFLQIAVGNLTRTRIRGQPYKLAVTGTTLGDSLTSDKPPSLPLFKGQTELRVFQGPKDCHQGTDSTFLLIHTDKPIYKPREVVRFRVLVLTSALKPYSNSNLSSETETPLLTVSVIDSRRNVIKTWPGVTAPPDGIFRANLTLSTEPVLGDWVIQVQLSSQNSKTKTKSLSFSVDQYVLPKFDVELLLSSFATFDGPRSLVTAHVKASYTYGKAVQTGHVVVTVAEESPSNYHHGRPDFEEEEDLIPGGRVPRMASPSPSLLVTKSVQLVNGSAFVDFDLAKDLNLQGHGDTTRTIRVNATLVESLTGKRATATSTIMVHKYPYTLDLIAPNYYKPGLPFTVTVAVTHQDGTPVHDDRPDAFVVRHPFSYTDEGSVYKAPIPAFGLVPVTFTPPSNELLEVRDFEVAYKGVKQWFGLPERVTTSSKVYLNLVQVDGTGNEGKNHVQVVRVKVESNKPFQTVHYQVVSQGKYGIAQLLTESSVTRTNTKALPTPKNETTLELSVHRPQSVTETETVTLVAYILADVDENHEKAELIADSIEIKFKAGQESKSKLELNNHLNVKLKLSESSAEPGQNVTLELGTRPGSLVALQAVDQSVLVLKEDRDRDIDLKSVEDEIESLRDKDNGNNYYFGSSFHSSQAHAHSARVFENAGFVLMTNAKLHQLKYGYGGSGFEEDEQEISAGGSVPPKATPATPALASIRIRSHFPETWIWEEVEGGNGHFSKTLVVPDTLTSWIITGYSIHPEYGLGLLRAPEKLTVVRPFFVTLNVPHSAVRGEVVAVQVLMHNYLDYEAEVRVTLDNERQQFDFFNEPNSTSPSVGIKSVKGASSAVESVTFIIVPTKFDTIELAVKGVAVTVDGMAGDALSRPLIVKPPGQRHTVNKVVLIDHRALNTSSMILKAVFPGGRVAGADQLRLSVVSDILGPTIANLGDLLQMPYGCGEQNLVNFVPDIVILDYLTQTGQVVSGIQAKALQFLESGYQRQLTYAHEDGSFSAFGATDQYGSTWLTAFTIKSFYAAKPYITVDDKVIEKGLRFLEGQQRDDGALREPGRVLHSGLQGGSGKGLALTAYVLLAFVEVTKGTVAHKAVINKGLQYLVSQFHTHAHASTNSSMSQDLYGLILVSYVLELAKHPMRDEISALVEKHAKTSTDGEFKYWEELREPPSTKTKPLSVEMSSYHLLTYLAQNANTSLSAALPVVKWLLAQRNAAGGFISTQDTVVGLAALGKFAEITQGSNCKDVGVDLNITAKYGTAASNFRVGLDNAIVLQTHELPSDIRAVTVQASGHGMALVQLTSTYYVENMDTAAQEQQFEVRVKVNRSTTTSKELRLEICTRFIRKDGAPSNMAVVEVSVPTGYTFDAKRYKMGDGDAELLALPRVMRVDLAESDTQLNIYYDHITSSGQEPPSCVSLRTNLIHRVAKQSPAHVRVYDYYDTTRMGQASYEVPNLGHELCADNSDGVDKANWI